MKNYSYFFVITLFVVFFISNLGLLNAQEGPDVIIMEFQFQEEAVIMSASNVARTRERQPVSVTTISRQELELSGARTLSEAIMTFVPGFFLVEDQDDIIAGFRGLVPDNNSKVMLLVDGQNVNTEWFWGPPDAILNTINYDWVDHIEVIKGPGSVTLGQGALLGVINIITKKGFDDKKIQDGVSTSIYGGSGIDKYYLGALDTRTKSDKLKSYFYVSSSKYDGQKFRNEGWARSKIHYGFRGGTVFTAGHRLKRTDNSTMFGSVNYKNFEVDIIYSDQLKDIYNFYRDRERVREILTSYNVGYKTKLSENIRLRTNLSFIRDDFALSSVIGLTTGGTRENRYGFTSILNFDRLFKNNELAVGVEYRRFEFGRENINGDNFIVNSLDSLTLSNLTTANSERTWGYPAEIDVYSIFAEDFYKVVESLDIFGAFRYDNHPFWGSNISPRLGALYSLNKDIRFRLSWQTGFRGASGVHYGGGFRKDGLLRADNLNKVEKARIPIYDNGTIVGYQKNISEVKPEKMHSFELAGSYYITNSLKLDAVGFYNIVQNIIDVGVIWTPVDSFPMVKIGTDIPGDWNGYWFYKNSAGNIKEYGTEAVLTYNTKNVRTSLSHSFVKVASASEEQRTSMYLTKELNFKAFPENVTRFNILFSPINKLTLGLNYLYYYKWFSPRDQEGDANHIINSGIGYNVGKGIEVSLLAKNLLNQKKLYPMNSNAEDLLLSDGTPALEETTFWFKLSYKP